MEAFKGKIMSCADNFVYVGMFHSGGGALGVLSPMRSKGKLPAPQEWELIWDSLSVLLYQAYTAKIKERPGVQ